MLIVVDVVFQSLQIELLQHSIETACWSIRICPMGLYVLSVCCMCKASWSWVSVIRPCLIRISPSRN
jgi:hypothetical protein